MSNLPLKKLNDDRIDVDLCFVCDCTNTMQPFISQVLNDITNLVATVSLKLRAKLRVAFVAYRDYPSVNSMNPEARIECYDFTANVNEFISFVQQIKTDGGGGDRCEDVLGGLYASLSLKWSSPTKVLFHICDDPPHGVQYHSFFDEIEENRLQLMEFMQYDSEICADIFGRDSWEFAWIFQFENDTRRQEALQQYISSRKKERDRFPDKHAKDADHEDILLAMKEKRIEYHIASKTKNVNKMIDVFKQSGANIEYTVNTSELTACQQLFGAVYHSISTAITISKQVKHTQIIQQRARRLFLDAKQNHIFKVFCGIDFGTDGTAFSYCLPHDDEVYCPDWGGDDRIVDSKLKTNILLDRNNGFKHVAFGQRAREMYMKLEVDDDDEEEEEEKNDLLFFEKFKMALFAIDSSKDDEKEDINEELTAINGQKCDSKTVIIEALKFVKTHALHVMNRNGLDVAVDDCQWVLTVPAIWSHRSKGIMMHCAAKSGLINTNITNHLIIAFEPDCASIAIQHEYQTQKKQRFQTLKKKVIANKNNTATNQRKLGKGTSMFGPDLFDSDSDNDDYDNDDYKQKTKPKQKKKQNKNVETPGYDMEEKEKLSNVKKSAFSERDKFFARGEKYILADLGGGTADLVCHEILSQYNVREIYKPSGGPFGSTFIDEEFVNLLSKIISKRWMKEFKINEPHKYVELLHFFQISKHNFWQKRNFDGTFCDDKVGVASYHNVKLPFEFIQFLEEKLENINNTMVEDEDVDVQKLETLFNDYSNQNIGVECGYLVLEDQHLKIHDIVWQYLFDCVVIPICNHISDLIDKLSVKHEFKYLLLAGGFCESKYVGYKLLNMFGMRSKYKLRIVIPRRPILQVVTGAALYCKNQCYVKSRILRNTIGIEIRQSLRDFEDTYNQYITYRNDTDVAVEVDEEENDDGVSLLDKYENEKYIADKIVLDGHLKNKFVDCVFYKFVSCGDELQIDDPPKIQYFKPIDKDSQVIEIKLFEFEEEREEEKKMRLFTDDRKCKLLATKKIRLPKEWINKNNDSNDIPIAFFFGDTQIKIYIGIEGLNENDANIHLDYKYYHK